MIVSCREVIKIGWINMSLNGMTHLHESKVTFASYKAIVLGNAPLDIASQQQQEELLEAELYTSMKSQAKRRQGVDSMASSRMAEAWRYSTKTGKAKPENGKATK